MKHAAFSAVEAILTVGIIAVTAGVVIPTWQNVQYGQDLDSAAEQLVQALRRAQLLSRAGESDSQWGVYISDDVGGVILFRGREFDGASDEDEFYPFPSTVTVAGIEEISFASVTGIPSVEGNIILIGGNGTQRTVTVTNRGGIVAEPENDEGGVIVGQSSSAGAGNTSSSSTAFTASTSNPGSAGASASGAGGTGPSGSQGSSVNSTGAGGTTGGNSADTQTSASVSLSPGSSSFSSTASTASSAATSVGRCEDKFVIEDDGEIVLTGTADVVVEVLGSVITYGAGGPEVDVTLDVSTDGGRTWRMLFNGIDVDGGELETLRALPRGARIVLRATGRHGSFFHRVRYSNEGAGWIKVLRHANKTLRKVWRTDAKQYINDDGSVALGAEGIVMLMDLDADAQTTSAYDLEDAAIHIEVKQHTGACPGAASSVSSASTLVICNPKGESQGTPPVLPAETLTVPSTSWPAYEANGAVRGACSDVPRKIICHFPGFTSGASAPGAAKTIQIFASLWPQYEGYGDYEGECGGDEDSDGVPNVGDLCPGTKNDQAQSVPKLYLGFWRYALTEYLADSTNIFHVGPRKKISEYTLADTYGCNCKQLLDVAEGKGVNYFMRNSGLWKRYVQLRGLQTFYLATARKFGCGKQLMRFVAE